MYGSPDFLWEKLGVAWSVCGVFVVVSSGGESELEYLLL